MKSFIKKIIRQQGFEILKFQNSPYEYLKNITRYEETLIDLLGKKFKIADSLSFYWSFREIFLSEIYKFESLNDSPFILDCGSNYGTSITYFKSIYPEAKIVAIEPDPMIFGLLEWNMNQRNYSNVTLINRAVSVCENPITFYREGADGGRAIPNSTSSEKVIVKTINLDDLIAQPVDFLKMDIEGSETEVLCSSEKLKDVNQLFIEYHSFKETPQTLGNLLEKLSSNGFRYYIHTQFCSSRPLTKESLQLGMDLQLNIFAKRSVY